MSATLQTFLALALVALAAVWLIWRSFGKRKKPGCGSEGCGAVSPEVKKLQARLKH